jgi:hypothetical protein
MPKYTVETAMDNGRGFTLHHVLHITASTAVEAIRRGHRVWTREGWPGPFRFTSAENVDDPHDYWREVV